MPFGATPSSWCVCQFHHFRRDLQKIKESDQELHYKTLIILYLFPLTDRGRAASCEPSLQLLYTWNCSGFKLFGLIGSMSSGPPLQVAAACHLIGDRRFFRFGKNPGGQGKEFRILEMNVAFVHLRQFGHIFAELLDFIGCESAGRKVLPSQTLNLVVKRPGAAMVALQIFQTRQYRSDLLPALATQS